MGKHPAALPKVMHVSIAEHLYLPVYSFLVLIAALQVKVFVSVAALPPPDEHT